MTTLGYYLNCDDAFCVDHKPATIYAEIVSGPDGAADSPTHCTVCEVLIPHLLTSEGLEYVRDAYCSAAARMLRRDPVSGGRAPIVRAWVLQYLPSQAHIVADWPTRDQWSPQARSEA